jgi:hypothetical protein
LPPLRNCYHGILEITLAHRVAEEGTMLIDQSCECACTCSFPNVAIMRQKEKDVAGILYEKLVKDCQRRGYTLSDADLEQLKERADSEHVTIKDCLHSVRFGFHAVLTDPSTGQTIATPVTYSEPIFNTR